MSAVLEMTPPGLQRLMVTRPLAEAQAWAQSLKDFGWPAQALPLIDIAPPGSPAVLRALESARAAWLDWDVLMFVSGAAVTHFFASGVPVNPPAQPLRTRFWAPGPGTARALSRALAAHGVAASQIDTPAADALQFDSEALWAVVGDQIRPGARVLVVRGTSDGPEVPLSSDASVKAGHGRDWLIARCEAAGAQVEACVAYERRAPAWSAEKVALAKAAAQPASLWLFSSSEAIQHLQQGLPGVSWASASALATHPRIAQSARAAGFLNVQESRPSLEDVARALKSHWSPL